MRGWRLSLLFIGIATILILNNGLLYLNFSQVKDNQWWVEHTHQVIRELESVAANLSEIESEGRGYFLTKDASFLEQADVATADLSRHIDALKRLTADNPRQQETLQRLQELIQIRLNLQHRKREKIARGEKLTLQGLLEGKQTMDRVQEFLNEVGTTERDLLAERNAQTKKSAETVVLSFLIGLIVNLVLTLASYYLIRRHLMNQDRALAEQMRTNWLQSHITELLRHLEGVLSIAEITQRSVQYLTTALNVPAGSLFLFSDGRLTGAASLGGRLSRTYRLGESLVGGAAQRQDIFEVSDVPTDYFSLSSSLGEAQPRCLVFVPLYFETKLIGVIELAAFRSLENQEKELLEQLQDRIATLLSSAISRERQQELLEETQRQAEELQTQQEELRSSNEELEQQTSALQSSQERLQSQQEELRQINEELEAQAKTLEDQRENLNERNRALEAASRYKSEFLAKMSHELRTPLNSMLILSSLLSEDKERRLSHDQREYATTIHKAGGDLLTLISDILDLSKLEARKLSLNPEKFTVSDLCQSLERQFRPMVEEKGLKFDISVGSVGADTLFTDRQRLEQILRNLLSNAIKFTEKGSVTLQIRPGQNPEHLRFIVKDTGIGIPEEKKAKIFEAFEQVDSSTSRRYGGTGLGLTISMELAALLQGHVELDSREGRGSEFTLEIPSHVNATVVHSSEPLALETPPPMVPSRRERKPIKVAATTGERTVLIIEDDETFRKASVQAAATFGFKGITAADAEEAFAVLEAHLPAAILLDLKLPGMSGFGVLETIKRNPAWRHIPIHIISGHDYPMYALRLGAVGFLPKPANLDSIRSAFAKIERVIDRHIKRLLIIEDDEVQLKALTELLRSPETEIEVASRAMRALELLDAENFDCVILDLTLPDMSGLDLLEKIHHDHKVNVPPIIIYTGRELSRAEEDKLRHFSESIIIKGAKSPERLLDEVNLFLHRLESELPEDKRVILADLRVNERDFQGATVLLVDDDLRNVFAMTSALESKGLKVAAARNGLEALDALEKNKAIDLVLMDIMMPKMDGYEAIRRIRQMPEHKKLPIIALTAKAMKGDHEKCIAAGANDYLPKPVNLMNLLSLLKVWLGSHKGMNA